MQKLKEAEADLRARGVAHAPDSLLERHASLPWKQTMGIGDALRHNYDNVVETIVWETVQNDLARLMAVVAVEIDAIEGKL